VLVSYDQGRLRYYADESDGDQLSIFVDLYSNSFAVTFMANQDHRSSSVDQLTYYAPATDTTAVRLTDLVKGGYGDIPASVSTLKNTATISQDMQSRINNDEYSESEALIELFNPVFDSPLAHARSSLQQRLGTLYDDRCTASKSAFAAGIPICVPVYALAAGAGMQKALQEQP
jgi:hypothetical protein